jgi:spore coat polysaccharide biosynthesis protein SpsF (cytidylyltransferase family)
MQTGALIPIRLDSSRLPGKALLDVAGCSALHRLVTQVAACKYVDRSRIVVCTTERPQDDPLMQAAAELGIGLFRGSTDDLIDRMYRAAREHRFDVVLQIDGDDILADPDYMTRCVESVQQGRSEVCCCGAGLPLGSASKAFRFEALRKVFETYVPGTNDTGFGYFLTRSKLFQVATVDPVQPADVMPELRLTLDYPEDLELFRAIYSALRGSRAEAVRTAEICALVRSQPHLLGINAGLDEGYWERTRQIMEKHPLQLRVGDGTVDLDVG